MCGRTCVKKEKREGVYGGIYTTVSKKEEDLCILPHVCNNMTIIFEVEYNKRMKRPLFLNN